MERYRSWGRNRTRTIVCLDENGPGKRKERPFIRREKKREKRRLFVPS